MRYQSNRPKRQFLAGVACPSCKALDKVVQIQLYQPEYDEHIECTACGYSERRQHPMRSLTFSNLIIRKPFIMVTMAQVLLGLNKPSLSGLGKF